jgi:hypothetical protein
VLSRLGPASAFDLLAATSLTRCIDTGAAAGGVANCSLVMVVTGALQNGESDGSGGLLFDLASAPAEQLPGGDGFTAVSVPDAVSIALFQSAITLRYPTTYVEDVNDGPYEATFLTDGAGARFGLGNACLDGGGDAAVGCGWQVDAAGAHIPFSQGFCCRCSVVDTLESTYVPRNGQTCAFAARRDSAQCLRMAPLWHSAYAIGAPSIDFVMVLVVLQCRPTAAALAAAANTSAAAMAALRCDAPALGCVCAMLDSAALGVPLGPREPNRCFALPLNPDQGACDIQVSLEGTFAAYDGTPDFSDKLLLVPTACAAPVPASDPCWNRLVEAPGRWLVVERNAVSVAGGSECNKVGVGYQAFATQGAACASPRGTCLANQPRDIYAADAATVAAGRAPAAFLSAFREASAPNGEAGAPALDATAAELLAARTASRTLALPTQRFQKSVVTMTFRADPGSLRLAVKASSGRLLSADVPPFAAGSTGALLVRMASTGAVASHFTISLLCPPQVAILPVPARDLSVAAGANASAAFTLQPSASTAAASGSCDIMLFSALGAELDRVAVAVNQTEAPRDVSGQGGTHVGANGGGAGAATNATGASGAGISLCGTSCPSWWNLACAAGAAASCVGELSGWSAGIGLCALTLALLALKQPALLLAPLRAAARLCCASGGGGVGGGGGSAKGEAQRTGGARAPAVPVAAAGGSSASASAVAAASSPVRLHPSTRRHMSHSPPTVLDKSHRPGGKGSAPAATAIAARPGLDGPALIEMLRRSAHPSLSPRLSVRAVDVGDGPLDAVAPVAPRGRGRLKHAGRRDERAPQ